MQKGMEAIQEGSLPSPIFSLHLMGGGHTSGSCPWSWKVAGADGGETSYQGIAPAPSLC